MDTTDALAVFAALSQGTRLAAYRLLIKAGREGILSGELSTMLDVRQNTMSANLTVLLNAGLIRNERHGRTVRYFADLEALQGLLQFLLKDCCGGRAEVCDPIIRELAEAC